MAAVGKHEKKAKASYDEAVKQTKRWFGGDSRYENAAELFSKSALSYKLAKKYTESVDSYVQAAEMHAKLGNDSDLATAYREAGLMSIKAGDMEGSEKYLKQAAELYEEMDRISTAGKMYKEIAGQFEDAHEPEKAREFYQMAADAFGMAENATSARNQCLNKVALMYGDDESYGKAAEVFEEVAKQNLKSNLLKFNARGQFTNAVMCYMANDDMVMVARKLDEFKERDYQFADSRECKLLEACASAYEEHNVDRFVDALAEYDRISKLDPWRIAILLKVKGHITGGAGEDDGGGDGDGDDDEVDLS